MGLKRLLSKIGSAIADSVRWVLRIREPEVQDRVLDAVRESMALVEYALPAVRAVAALTPSPADDLVVEALGRLGLAAADVLSLEGRARAAALLDLAVEATRIQLERALAEIGTLRVGPVVIARVSELSDSMLRAAVDYTYGVIFKRS